MSAIWDLFLTFLKIGLLSIGGGYAVIPLIQEQLTARPGWISEKMFADIITISQMTPGPLAVNASTFVGLRIGGPPGALAATLGCILCGVMASLFLYRFLQKRQGSVYMLEILDGLKSASLGLIVSAGATIIMLALFDTGEPALGSLLTLLDYHALIIFLGVLIIIRRKKLNPVIAMLISGLAGLIFYGLKP